MAFAAHHNDHTSSIDEYDGRKGRVEHIPNLVLGQASTSRRRREAPPLIRDLSSEDRQRLELALVRKIDSRLLPMIILMYVLNYLDRNNIASARLAGLEDDLKLSSVQYNVRRGSSCIYTFMEAKAY